MSTLKTHRGLGRSALPAAPAPARSRPGAAGASSNAFGPRFAHDFSRVPLRGEDTVRIAQRGLSGPGDPYPFRDQLQHAFGARCLDGIRAHTDGRAVDAARVLGARAFTFGNDVAFDGAPDLHTAAHEAVHALQRQPSVARKAKSHACEEKSAAPERDADAVADAIAGNPSGDVSRASLLCKGVPTRYGCFQAEHYVSHGSKGSESGVEMKLTFDPFDNVDATKIGLTQTVRIAVGEKAVAIHPSQQERIVRPRPNEGPVEGEGRQIDQLPDPGYANPLYATGAAGPNDELGDTPVEPGRGRHGFHHTDSGGKIHHESACLSDTPKLSSDRTPSSQVFETAALAVAGAQSGMYMGSVEWGWVKEGGDFRPLPLTLVSAGVPSAGFMAAARAWNRSSTAGKIVTAKDPTIAYSIWDWKKTRELKAGVEVEVGTGSLLYGGEMYNDVKISGEAQWRIRTNDLRDAGGDTARPTIDLPVDRLRVTLRGGPADVRSSPDTTAPVIATLAAGTMVNLLSKSHPYQAEIEVDASQPGVTLPPSRALGGAYGVQPPRPATGKIQGYIPRAFVD